MALQYDTIIVGAGAAGVTAAEALVHSGMDVLLLEASDAVGGRVCTVPFGNGVVELGAEWMHGDSPSRVFKAAVTNKITVKYQNLSFNMYRSDGSLPEKEFHDTVNELIEYAFLLLGEPIEEPQPVGKYITERLTAYIKGNKADLIVDDDFMTEILEFLNLLTNNYCATNDWNDLNAKDKYTPIDGHQHISWHKYGYKTFFDIMLNKYKTGAGFANLEIKLNSEVIQILWPQDRKDKVTVMTKDGTNYIANHVIVTVSLGVLKESYKTLFTPKLTPEKVFAIETIAFGVMDKIILSFVEPWWPRDVSFFGFMWKGEDKKKVGREDYWITRIFAASTPMGSDNALTLWTSGEVAKMVEMLPKEVVIAKCMYLLRKFMGAKIEIPEPTGFLRSTWYSNPFTRGSYSYDAMTAALHPEARAALATPLVDDAGTPRVLFAGEATHETRYSTVHGASDTGYREAMRLLPGTKL